MKKMPVKRAPLTGAPFKGAPFTRVLCAVVFVVASVFVVAPPAEAAGHPGGGHHCVTKAEFRHVHKGMRKRRVTRIFDTRGHRVAYARHGRFTSEIRSYRPCRRRSAVSVSFGNRRVTAKAAVWRHRRRH